MNSKWLPFFPCGLVAFDLETTGLSPLFDKIIEIGAVKFSPDGSTTHFQELVQPGIPIPPDNSLIHGIRDKDVATACALEEVLPRFLHFIGDLPLVAHNAKFDSGFIVFSLCQQRIPLPDNSIYCSLALAKSVFRDVPNNRLSTLAKLLSIPCHQHHRAWNDASTCLQLVYKALEQSGERATHEWNNAKLYSLDEFKKFPPSLPTSPQLKILWPPINPWKSNTLEVAPLEPGVLSLSSPFSLRPVGTSCTLSATAPTNINSFFSTKFKV